MTDPDLLNTVYTYDGLNNLTALDSPDTGHTGYAYDAAGNRTGQTDNRSVTSTYAYDRLDRLTAIAYPTTSLNVTYAYDQPDATTGCSGSYPQGRLTRMTDVTGSTTYCYDRRGNVTKKTQVTGGTTLVTEYTYTVADRLDRLVYPSGAMVTYTRDATGRITAMAWGASTGARPTTLISSAAYLPFGPLKTLTFGIGRTLTKDYDLDYAINSISGTPAGAFTLDIVEVDVMGNIKKVSGTMNPTTPDRTYGYDALYRLKTSQTGATPPGPLESYTYNKTGDRQSASLNGGAASAYTYTAGTHHLASVGGVARTYDNNGNTLTGTSPGLTLTYDDRNRLASMVNGTTSATYAITGRGERVGKTVTVSGTPTTTLFDYDESGHLAGEYSGAGVVQAEYIYLDDTPVGVVKGGTLYYIETDHLGTPRQVVKPATNAVVWKWDFLQNTFGSSAPNQDPDGDSVQFVLGMRFPGQYYDVDSGSAYNYYRDYDAVVGRYLSEDPLGLAAGLNGYTYVDGNPIAEIDPLGLEGYGSWSYWKPPAHCGCDDIVKNAMSLNDNETFSFYHDYSEKFPVYSNKCNLFVYYVLTSTGFPPRRYRGLGGPISAGTWADPNATIPHFPVTSSPGPGAIAAIATPGHEGWSGHVAIVLEPGKTTIGAGKYGSHITGWPWDPDLYPQGTAIFRQCTCED